MVSATVRTFAPERWGQVELFRQFYIGTHRFNSDTAKALSGVTNHFQKALTLHQLAIKLTPNISIDREELQRKGYTSAANSREVSAVIEEVFTELYSSVDCTRKIIVSIYRKTRGMPDSTRKLFQRVKDNRLGSDFPTELKQIIAASDWYEELREIRDELTHSDIGSCSLDQKTSTITYIHTGINREGRALIINDIMGRIQSLITSVNEFLGAVFNFLFLQLNYTTIDQLCGFFHGRAYYRKLPLEMPISFHSGVCQSRAWFDSKMEFRCPFADSCGAYFRSTPTSSDATPGQPS